jgi:hypothetical protein
MKKELQQPLQRFKTVGDVILMEFGLEKCASIVLKKGKLIYRQH